MGLRLSQKELQKILKNNSDIEINETSKQIYNKYHNKKIVINGIKYDSKKEYQRHCELKILEKTGKISNLRFHDKKDIIILQSKPLIKYEPDFCYEENGILIIEDLKGYQTKEFKLKKKIIINKINNDEIIGKFRLTKYNKNKFDIIEEYFKKESN